MNSEVLISAETLLAQLSASRLRIADVRFDLADPSKGAALYRGGHLPGAIHADLERDLSDLRRSGLGRHPLPESKRFADWLCRVGYAPDQTWVVYDDGNAGFAARLWWMLRAIGHRDVRVLDGGFAAWLAANGPITDRAPEIAPTSVVAEFDADKIVDFAKLDAIRTDCAWRLIDARSSPRFRGEFEPIDRVAGHVPGAINRPFTDNFGPDGRFKAKAALRDEWLRLIGDVPATRVVHMCGSGVTACVNLLAMEHAGLVGSRLFPPSWSGWISDPNRPIATGDR